MNTTDNQVELYSYRVLKFVSKPAVSARHLHKMIYYLCEIIRGSEKHLNSEYPSVRKQMESLVVPVEYREAVLEKVVRAMLILNGWSNDDPGLEETVQRIVIRAKSFDKNWGV